MSEPYNDWMEPFFILNRYLKAQSSDFDLKETEQAYILKAEIPGIKQEEIDIEYKDGILIINLPKGGQRKQKEFRTVRL